MNKLEAINRYAEQMENKGLSVGKATSVADTLKQIHQALNENRPEFYAIPQDRELIAQEFLLFENSGADDLERLVDNQFSQARVTIKQQFWVKGFA